MADEEDDYMSSSFVLSATPQLKETNARRKAVGKAPIKKPPPEKPKTFKQLEADSIKQGLSSALSEDNKGFKMLKLMGYKEGSGLGKDESGSVEAIPLNIKRSRAGLGEEEDRKRKIDKIVAKRVKYDSTLLDKFRGSVKDKFATRKLVGQLKSITTICKNLDETKGITTNELIKEPDPEPPKTEDEKEQEEKKEKVEEKEPDPEEMLENFVALHNYCRDQHSYCFFCGTRYDNEEDMTKNCPGILEDDH